MISRTRRVQIGRLNFFGLPHVPPLGYIFFISGVAQTLAAALHATEATAACVCACSNSSSMSAFKQARWKALTFHAGIRLTSSHHTAPTRVPGMYVHRHGRYIYIRNTYRLRTYVRRERNAKSSSETKNFRRAATALFSLSAKPARICIESKKKSFFFSPTCGPRQLFLLPFFIRENSFFIADNAACERYSPSFSRTPAAV